MLVLEHERWGLVLAGLNYLSKLPRVVHGHGTGSKFSGVDEYRRKENSIQPGAIPCRWD